MIFTFFVSCSIMVLFKNLTPEDTSIGGTLVG